jgi:hypothetical protein
MKEAEVLADHAAHRQAEEARLLDAAVGHEIDHVLGERLEGVGAFGRFRLAVAAGIEPKDAVAGLERGGELVPAGEIGRQGMMENDGGGASGAGKLEVDVDAVNLSFHGISPVAHAWSYLNAAIVTKL